MMLASTTDAHTRGGIASQDPQARPLGALIRPAQDDGDAVPEGSNPAMLRCIVCRDPFDFAAGESAVVLRHIAYGYDFAHAGSCLVAARAWIFVEPGYDRPAFSLGRERVRIVGTAAADGWAAVVPGTPEQVLAGTPISFEPLRCWAVVEHGDGSRRVEGIVRDPEWEDEPGGAEFPEARHGRQAIIGYASEVERLSPARRAKSAAPFEGRFRGEPAIAHQRPDQLDVRRAV